MDKEDLILERLTAMDRALRAEISALKTETQALRTETEALRTETKALRTETKAMNESLSGKLDMTWQAVTELRDDKTEINELRRRIDILETKVG
jgi:chromosome segregation ATPase